jgi:hypothetical protein
VSECVVCECFPLYGFLFVYTLYGFLFVYTRFVCNTWVCIFMHVRVRVPCVYLGVYIHAYVYLGVYMHALRVRVRVPCVNACTCVCILGRLYTWVCVHACTCD